ncbi:MAG: hypothetical protein O9262_07850 [Cyclobacteriaceae bacterium]|nr:hypothetical protein [Cyclobacteriaceae bacterium]
MKKGIKIVLFVVASVLVIFILQSVLLHKDISYPDPKFIQIEKAK